MAAEEKKSRFENEAPNGPNGGKRCRRKRARKCPPGKEIGYRTGGAGDGRSERPDQDLPQVEGGGHPIGRLCQLCFCRRDGRVGYALGNLPVAHAALPAVGLQAVKARMEGPVVPLHRPVDFADRCPC